MPARFTIVSAVYDVARYLADFIASVEAQDHPSGDLEVIMVDDGSTDGSALLLADWRRRRPDLVTVLTQPNGGQASARNRGLERAHGEWITFTDPDDMLAPDVLSTVARFVAAQPAVELVALNRVLLDDTTGRRRVHPLAVHFGEPDTVRDLDAHPTYFYGSAPCAFFRRAELVARGVRFDEQLRPAFEDGLLCDTYLLRAPAPLVGFLRSAVYVYRKRSDGSSTLNTAKADVRRYTTVFERGYLALFEEAERRTGAVPRWLQTHVLYELSWLFQAEDATPNPVLRDAADEVHRLLAALAARLDPGLVQTFALRHFATVWRELLLHGYRSEPWHTPFAVVDQVDPARRAMRVGYRHTGAPPAEEYTVDATVVTPIAAQTRPLPYFQRALLHERTVWVPYGTLSVSLDGTPILLSTAEPDPPCYQLEGWRVRDAHAPLAPRPGLVHRLGRRARRLTARAIAQVQVRARTARRLPP